MGLGLIDMLRLSFKLNLPLLAHQIQDKAYVEWD